jgi:predicted tellurium resistance membrane protein TerC
MDWLTDPQTWIALLTLTSLEVVLGIDNIIFISILAGKLPEHQQRKARPETGLGLAMITRILLAGFAGLDHWTDRSALQFSASQFSGRDLILIGGGVFLLAKSTREIHDRLEGKKATPPKVALLSECDRPDTAAGYRLFARFGHHGGRDGATVGRDDRGGDHCSHGIMLFSAEGISDFVNRHPTVKMLALSFLLLIGFTLVVEGLHQHIPKGYTYFAMGFSVFVEMLNLRMRTARQPVQLHQPYQEEKSA